MKITRIEIKNFRSIAEVIIEPSMFNVQVGQNNHGKTNYFEALNWFFSGFSTKDKPDTICRRGTNLKSMSVVVTFSGLQAAIANMSNETKKKALQKIFNNNEDEIAIKREGSDPRKRFLLKPSGEWSDPIGADKTWGDLLPKLEYVSTQIAVHDINGYKKNSPIAEMLSGVLGAIIETDTQYQEFKEQFTKLFGDNNSPVRVELNSLGSTVQGYLQKQFPDGTMVNFNVENPIFDDLLKNFTTEVDDGVVTSAEEKGDGMQRALMLAIIQAYADYRRERAIARKFIFLIDEAELHLHPTAQRALKNALKEISTNGEQVFINTHSSVLISDDDQDEKIFEVKKNNGVTGIHEIEEHDKQFVVFELLGGSPADILLPKNFLIVEGASECAFLARIVDRFYPEYKRILILSAEGNEIQQGRSMNMVNKAYMPTKSIYGGRVVILCDKPEGREADFEKFINSYKLKKDEDYFILTQASLEEYYPSPWKKSSEETKELGKNREKVVLAKKVAEEITQEQFEEEMPLVFNALQKAAERAFD